MRLRVLVIDDKLGRSPLHQRQLTRVFAALVDDCRSTGGVNFALTVEFSAGQRFEGGCWVNDIEIALAAVDETKDSRATGATALPDWCLVLVDMQFDYGPVDDERDDPPLVAQHFGLEIEAALLARHPGLPTVRFTSSHERDIRTGTTRPFLSKVDVFSNGEKGVDALRMAMLCYGQMSDEVKTWLLRVPSHTPVASAALIEVYTEAFLAARSGEFVLLRGEAGTGKEVLAHYMHSVSGRSEGPFVGRSVASVPAELFESELFGIEKGAATGIGRTVVGEFEHAAGGTLLLDEIGASSPAHQAKLLRVLQERHFTRVGGRDLLEVKCLVVAATQDNVEERGSSGEFRRDLYDRFQRVLYIPPLRQRTQDIEPLARRVLIDEMARTGKSGILLAEDAITVLQHSALPKNARTVQQVLSRAMAAKSSQSVIRGADLVFDQAVPDTERPALLAPWGTNNEPLVPTARLEDVAEAAGGASRTGKSGTEAHHGIRDAPILERGALKQLRAETARRERRLACHALERCRHPVTGKLKIQPAMQYLMDDPTMTPMGAKRMIQKLMATTQRGEFSVERVEAWMRGLQQRDVQ